ncbi:hypothetical protein PFISCL1PPCAC_19466 [Pristionchus fissidentatus]|uniref:Uncharacterized protein n=1 Tax=Pristionchus fissidentatus TaxID=1538716 RepID=A0AAV5WBS4_9BILA|nr:hypothetical protein PFISCL1PPCAC_19466 [Pristionchus fissidentatus]
MSLTFSELSSILFYGDVDMDNAIDREEGAGFDFSPKSDRSPSEDVGLHCDSTNDPIIGSVSHGEDNDMNWNWNGEAEDTPLHDNSFLHESSSLHEHSPILDDSPFLDNTSIFDDTPVLNDSPLHDETPLLYESPLHDDTSYLDDDSPIHDYNLSELLTEEDAAFDYDTPTYGSLETTEPPPLNSDTVEQWNPVYQPVYDYDPLWTFEGIDDVAEKIGDENMEVSDDGYPSPEEHHTPRNVPQYTSDRSDYLYPSPSPDDSLPSSPHLLDPSFSPSPPSCHLPHFLHLPPPPTFIPDQSAFSWWTHKVDKATSDHVNYMRPDATLDGKTKHVYHPLHGFGMNQQLYDIKERNQWTTEMKQHCARVLDSIDPKMVNNNLKMALNKLISSKLSAIEVSSMYGLQIKTLARQDSSTWAPMPRYQRVKTKDVEMGEVEKKIDIVTQYGLRRKRVTPKVAQIFAAEEEVIIPPTKERDMQSLALCFALAFPLLSIMPGWEDMRAVKETINTINNAIEDGKRPMHKHIPKCDFVLDIETDVIPYYRAIIEQMKEKDLSHLVETRRVMIPSMPHVGSRQIIRRSTMRTKKNTSPKE